MINELQIKQLPKGVRLALRIDVKRELDQLGSYDGIASQLLGTKLFKLHLTNNKIHN